MYTLLGADGRSFQSPSPGEFGGNSKDKLYGKLTCGTAGNALGRGYEEIRVFFADKATAIAAGYRPCGNCMRAEYREWKSRQPGTA
ncbi:MULTISPECIES: Ada metal-binding domain-containing protein [unclassified Modestobacter]|uniref:Ada metal-binding domain-containing protein n=1 Tax=unclassified Modestobacter TaxID=2643866 RepID=UPI0022AA2B8D|nr:MULTISPECIES: Ada metal-binding domain-containing protein [unclassified Modestobacter]MCZ2826044.1 metal-binding protein [Modestobacter sp. VKM Ac-2981]MCZ2852891.1 metal-binding protein [Modestobacter sp. VKM Ac-2982]